MTATTYGHAQQPATHYVCREHNQPTDWRGRGCTACRTEHSLNRRQRRYLRHHPDER